MIAASARHSKSEHSLALPGDARSDDGTLAQEPGHFDAGISGQKLAPISSQTAVRNPGQDLPRYPDQNPAPHARHSTDHGTYDARVQTLPGPARSAGVVRKGLDAAAAQKAAAQGCGSESPAPLPTGEVGECEGRSPSRVLRHDGQRPACFSHSETIRRNTGWKMSPEAYRESRERHDKLIYQTERMALALESQGISARLEGSKIVAIGEVTGEIDELDNYRPIFFLPSVAQRERKPMLNTLNYFQMKDRLGVFMRYGVVTTGERVPVNGPLRERIQALSRKVSRWAHEAKERWNVEVLYRGTEFTVDEALTFHPHANVLYTPRQNMPAHRWKAFLSWTGRYFGAHWHDAGRLEKPQEAIKYSFKPGDLERLDPPALAWLYRETRRLKMAQPLGSFARFRESLEYKVTFDPDGKKHREKLPRTRKVCSVYQDGGAKLALVEKPKRGCHERMKVDRQRENIILARTLPQFRHGNIAQPYTLMTCFTRNPETEAGKQSLRILEERSREANQFWIENGAPADARQMEIAMAAARGHAAARPGEERRVAAFKVHTSRSTVRIGDGLAGSHSILPPDPAFPEGGNADPGRIPYPETGNPVSDFATPGSEIGLSGDSYRDRRKPRDFRSSHPRDFGMSPPGQSPDIPKPFDKRNPDHESYG